MEFHEKNSEVLKFSHKEFPAKGSEVALLRAFKVRQAQRGHSGIVEADEDSGPMLDADADAFIHGGFD